MDISGLSKAAVLAALYNASDSQGRGVLRHDPAPMTEAQARQILNGGNTHFDYLKGRVMKIDLSDDDVDTYLYNRNNGPNAAENTIGRLKR